MSSSETAIIDNYEALFASNSAAYAAYTLIFYEHILTLSDEVEVFWKRKFTGATAIFLLNRYLILLSYVLQLASVWIKSDYTCMVAVRTTDVFYYALYIPWAVFGALRAYALSNRNWPVAVLVFLLSLVPYGMDMGQYALGLTGYIDPVWGCATAIPDFGQTLATHLRWQTKGVTRLTLTATMYRDGMMYFIVLFILNSLRLILAMPLPFKDPLNAVGNISIFAQPLTVILVSHFLLDLQRASAGSVGLGISTLSCTDVGTRMTSTVVFDRVVGSMGASLDSGAADQNDFSEDSDHEHSRGRSSG